MHTHTRARTCTHTRARVTYVTKDPAVQKVDISPSTARTDLIFGAESIAWIQAIDFAPNMRSVRAVEDEI